MGRLCLQWRKWNKTGTLEASSGSGPGCLAPLTAHELTRLTTAFRAAYPRFAHYGGAVRRYVSGIYHLSAFDWALLIPYFSILFILSIYGVHRFETVRRYRKYRRKLLKYSCQPFEQLPKVTIQLPLYNERFVVERLLEEVSKIEYPHELLQIQVLDDSTDETHPLHGAAL